MKMAKLCTTIREQAFNLSIKMPTIPEYIIDNLKHNFFEWQEYALSNFLINEAIRKEEAINKPNHLMFNMATGSGKTMIMAALILYYFKQGRRHFIFFTNRNNIVDKTQNNFVNSEHSKYLFKDKIVIDDKTIVIKSVNNFSDNPQGIEIKFTSIQKLYNDIHIQRENQTTLDDLHKKDIVMLADEAHHFNTKTQEGLPLNYKKLNGGTSKDDYERLGWEHMVIQLILNRNMQMKNNNNVLLEFTATIPENASVAEKYENKTINEFTLKEFLSKGYTKEINLLSSSLEKKERILQALLLNWYRHAIALDYGIPNFKPVILFRSKTIDESKEDYEFFLNMIDNLKVSDFNFMKTISNRIPSKTYDMHENSESIIQKLIQYIAKRKIKYGKISKFLKNNFKENNIIITNSANNKNGKEKTEDGQEKLLNNLEDKDNHIRAIFTVERLTEGWDVLNLFDIVRLYQGQNTGGKSKKTPEATIKEKQLIGRGVRYYPFAYEDKLKNKRKFDDDSTHDLRILEELFYYTYDEYSRYISHLKSELKKDGYIRDDKEVMRFSFNDRFKKSDTYQKDILWGNGLEDDPNHREKTLDEIKKNFKFEERLKSFEVTEEHVVLDKAIDIKRLDIRQGRKYLPPIKFSNFENHIFRKSVSVLSKQENSVFRFEELKQKLEVKSIDDLRNNIFFGNCKLHISLDYDVDFEDLSGDIKYKILIRFLESLFKEINTISAPKVGSKKFTRISLSEKFDKPKEKIVQTSKINRHIPTREWYALDNFAGTTEEVNFIYYFEDHYAELKGKYDEVFLVRNEEIYKIFDFEKGRGFQPDFLLFLSNKEEALSYQIFIEPKGDLLKGRDDNFEFGREGWKADFLEQITKNYGFNKPVDVNFPQYRLIGFPFYNTKDDALFDEKFKKLLNGKKKL